MRDPQGKLTLTSQSAVRHLKHALPKNHFLHSNIARELVKRRWLIDFKFIDELNIESPRLPFVSYPTEWCDDQLLSAAELTLRISEFISGSGYELKDASAWNVIFENGNPIFCDHLSFQESDGFQWWGFGQFVRHFIFPLAVSKYKKIHSHCFFKIDQDGLSPNIAASILGFRRFLSRYWLLTLGHRTRPALPLSKAPVKPHKSNRLYLYTAAKWFLDGAKPRLKNNSHWLSYTEDRKHYSTEATIKKASFLKKWLSEIRPEWVVDLGCNSGEFSKIAASIGASVIALDSDHQCIQELFQSSRGMSIYPVLANLSDLTGGRGWSGEEFQPLKGRLELKADVLIMLALTHHLMVSNAIPMEEIAKFATCLTKQFVVVELIHETDPQLKMLCRQRNRSPDDFSIEKQRESWIDNFDAMQEIPLPGGLRSILVLRKK